ncbi:MAG: ABC transporter ATP-binding protein, partial [Gammaproteobacteria bacterium]|nr:ABC transporter ATP-binding protein [Gammaproteobacteria bacterium]
MLPQDSALGFFRKMIRPFGLYIFFQLLIIAFWAFDLSFRPYLVKLMLDHVATVATNPDHLQWLFVLMCVYVGMSFFVGLIFRVYNYLNLIIRPGLKAAVGQYVVQKLLKHSQQFYHDHLPGNIVNKIKELTTGVPELLDLLVDRLLPTFLTVVIALVFLSSVHVNFAIGLIVWITLYLSGSLYSTQYAQMFSREVAERRSELSGYYVDLFTNILTVRLFSAYQTEQLLTQEKLSLFTRAERSKDLFFMKLFFFQSISFTCYQVISLYFLYQGIANQTFSVGDFTLILSINIEVIQVLWLFSRDIGEFATHIG